MQYNSFTDLEAYKKCRAFRKWISKLIKCYFLQKEQSLLTNQITKASRSVTANLADPDNYQDGRHYYQDNIKFCRIARGSLMETLEHLITAFDENYITSDILQKGKKQHDECLKLINGYINYLNKSKK